MSKFVGIIDICANTVLRLKVDINDGIKIISDNRFHYRADGAILLILIKNFGFEGRRVSIKGFRRGLLWEHFG